MHFFSLSFAGKSQAPAAPDHQVPPGGWTQILLYMGWCEVSRGPGDGGSRDSRVRKKNTQIDGIQDGAPSDSEPSWDISGWILWFMVDITMGDVG